MLSCAVLATLALVGLCQSRAYGNLGSKARPAGALSSYGPASASMPAPMRVPNAMYMQRPHYASLGRMAGRNSLSGVGNSPKQTRTMRMKMPVMVHPKQASTSIGGRKPLYPRRASSLPQSMRRANPQIASLSAPGSPRAPRMRSTSPIYVSRQPRPQNHVFAQKSPVQNAWPAFGQMQQRAAGSPGTFGQGAFAPQKNTTQRGAAPPGQMFAAAQTTPRQLNYGQPQNAWPVMAQNQASARQNAMQPNFNQFARAAGGNNQARQNAMQPNFSQFTRAAGGNNQARQNAMQPNFNQFARAAGGNNQARQNVMQPNYNHYAMAAGPNNMARPNFAFGAQTANGAAKSPAANNGAMFANSNRGPFIQQQALGQNRMYGQQSPTGNAWMPRAGAAPALGQVPSAQYAGGPYVGNIQFGPYAPQYVYGNGPSDMQMTPQENKAHAAQEMLAPKAENAASPSAAQSPAA